MANLLLRDATGHATSTVFLALLATGVSIWIAWRDVKIFCARDVVDRSCFRFAYPHRGHTGARAHRFSPRQRTIAPSRNDWQRPAAGPGAGLIQFCGIRKRHNARRRSTQSAQDYSPRRNPKRAACGAIFILCAYTEVFGLRSPARTSGRIRCRCVCWLAWVAFLFSDC